MKSTQRHKDPQWGELAVELAVFAYLWQMASFVHVTCHFLVAASLGVGAQLHLAWQKLVPLYGWVWDKGQPHTSFMCEYDLEQIREAEAWKRASIGFAGQYGAMTYMLVVVGCSLRDRDDGAGGSLMNLTNYPPLPGS